MFFANSRAHRKHSPNLSTFYQLGRQIFVAIWLSACSRSNLHLLLHKLDILIMGFTLGAWHSLPHVVFLEIFRFLYVSGLARIAFESCVAVKYVC